MTDTDIGIIAVGGYDEVGRNMTAIRYGKEIVIMDMGLRLDRVQIHEDAETEKMHSLDLIRAGAIPDDTIMNNIEGTVKAIVCTHGHLDHIGAIPKLAHRYSAPIISTPFTMELISQEISSEMKFGVENELRILNAGETYPITEDISVEFIGGQHSIIDCVFAAIHTPQGIILYANDFKLDRTPVLGDAPDFDRLKSLGKEGVVAMIAESTNVQRSGKTPSEQIARDLVTDVLVGTEETKSGVLVTTFSSHIARIKTIVEAANKMGRRPILLGRSMERYSEAAKRLGYIDFSAEVRGSRRSIDKALKRVMTEGKEEYLMILTGHQGEPGAVLSRIANDSTPYEIERGDKVIFSANVIPNPLSAANRYIIETKLQMKGVRIYDDVHVSGHASREDHWELLRMVNPEQVIPSHGELSMTSAYAELAEEAGYVLGDTVHVLRNGQELCLR
ncbi:MAG: RNase J family beta-CASP ribonuclease [Methanocellales archaeon]|nr:RNase J family beta-CASP ribonuclease [Methanocellales archaeon]MDD3291171.1 RNase J family beta-CASP ribonuclease [Methanocellales archaeon]MDD5235271.1 RNase J family beta-CASP ribonuclease [Methanocellales archaeon]MDD5484573.1 RNase J family beta-CASP ribonuclease [Methanocellales archaeon]